MRKAILLSTIGLAMALGASEALAEGIVPGGTIVGEFSMPFVVGDVGNDPTLGMFTNFDNSSTASVGMVNSTDPTLTGSGFQQQGSVLTWGNNPGTSELIFFGGQVPLNPALPFKAGMLTYYNADSALNSLIFGASLSLSEVLPGTGGGELFLGTDLILISTTNNLTGTLAGDADYVNICGNGSQICGKSIEAYEESEGGTGVNAELDAEIMGDPQLVYTHVALSRTQPGSGPSGEIGDLPPFGGPIPEPSTWAMMLIGFLGLGFLGRRHTMKARVAA
jgi:PEP-CTERM motif